MSDQLLYTIERFLRRTGMPATTFGRQAMKDPRYVLDLRLGRESRPSADARVRQYMDRWGDKMYTPRSKHRRSQSSSDQVQPYACR